MTIFKKLTKKSGLPKSLIKRSNKRRKRINKIVSVGRRDLKRTLKRK